MSLNEVKDVCRRNRFANSIGIAYNFVQFYLQKWLKVIILTDPQRQRVHSDIPAAIPLTYLANETNRELMDSGAANSSIAPFEREVRNRLEGTAS